MGVCGILLIPEDYVAGTFCELTGTCNYKPILSHMMCPHLYISAFKNNFTFDNRNNCKSDRMVKNLPADFKMGYMEKRRRLELKVR